MLEAELVREMVARKQRGEGVKRIARDLGVDRKTVKRWLRFGGWQPRQAQRRAWQLDGFAEFLERRAAYRLQCESRPPQRFMEPTHYAGLLRPGRHPSARNSAALDPYFGSFGEVMVRDLKLYEAISKSQGGEAR